MAARMEKTRHPGIYVKHRYGCASADDARCNCKPAYQAAVWIARDRKRVRKEFPRESEALAWREDTRGKVRRGSARAPSKLTLRAAAEAWLEGVKDGTIRDRSGRRFKPSTLRSYEGALRQRVLPDLSGARLSEISRNDLQDLADRLLADDLSPSTVRNVLMPLRAIYRRAVGRSEVTVNPTSDLDLPAVEGKRDRIVPPEHAARLIAALPADERALWAVAFYAGPRLGELRALRASDVDLAAGVLRIERGWDRVEGEIETKSRNRRTIPVPAALRDALDEHLLASGRRSNDLLLGRTPAQPFEPTTARDRARKAWRAAGLEGVGFHEARHTFASLMIAAGVNAKAISTYMAHSSITITYDRYGHLMPGNEAEAAGMMDAYLERANTAARLAALD